MDIFTKKKRSEVMSKIRPKNTKPEIAVRKLFHRLGFRFRLHNKKLPGRPDLSLPKYETAVFVHGCFWHHHKKCRQGKFPKSNLEYWLTKIEGNVARDKRKKRALQRRGWKVLTIWECELKEMETLEAKILKAIKKR